MGSRYTFYPINIFKLTTYTYFMGGLRRVWYLLLFILIVGLFFYDNVWYMERDSRIEKIGKETQHFGKIINISEGHFYIHTGSSNLRIESSYMPEVRKVRFGETVVHVMPREGGIVEGIDYHNYDYNYLLYIISFIALVVFIVLFFKEWRVTFGGFEDA